MKILEKNRKLEINDSSTVGESKFYLFILFAEVLVYLSNDMYLGGIVSMKEDLKIGDAKITLAMTSWFVGASSFQLVAGWLARFIKKIHLLMFGCFVFALSNLICWYSSNFDLMMGLRFLQGSAIAFVVMLGYSIIHESYSGKRTIEILSIMNALSIVAPALGPAMGAGVSRLFGWRWIFFGLGLSTLGVMPAIWSSLPKENNVSKKNNNISDAIRDYVKIIKNRDFIRFGGVCCLRFASSLLWILSGPFLITSVFGRTELEFGIMQLIVCCGFPVGSIFLRFMMRKGNSIDHIIKMGLWMHSSCAILLLTTSLENLGGNLYSILTILVSLITSISVNSSALNRLAVEAEDGLTTQSSALLSNLMGLTGVLCGAMVWLVVRFEFVGFAILTIVLSVASWVLYLSGSKPELKN